MEFGETVAAAEAVSLIPNRLCPLCQCAAETLDELQNHVATHLQRIALFALPRSTHLGDAGSQEDIVSGRAQDEDSSQDDMIEFDWSTDDSEASFYVAEPTAPLTLEALRDAPLATSSADADYSIARFLSVPETGIWDYPTAESRTSSRHPSPATSAAAIVDLDEHTKRPFEEQEEHTELSTPAPLSFLKEHMGSRNNSSTSASHWAVVVLSQRVSTTPFSSLWTTYAVLLSNKCCKADLLQ